MKTMIQIDNKSGPDGPKKIVIYDSARGFSRFIKTKLDNQFEITVVNSKQELKREKMSEYCTIFFIVNDAVDALLFSNLYYNAEQVFLGIATRNLEERLVKYNDIIPMDLELPKRELMHYIQHHLK